MKRTVTQLAALTSAVAGAVASLSLPAHAGSVAGTGGATEVTQIMNNVELLQQSSQMYQQVQNTIQQVQMAQQQLKNLIAAPTFVVGQVQQDLYRLTSLVNQGQALGYALGNIDQKFAEQFPGYGELTGGFKTKAQEWARMNLDGLKGAIQAAGLQSNLFATEHAAMQNIRSIASSAPGALQAAQAGVMVAGMQVEQLQVLRHLFATQMQVQNAYLTTEVQRKATAEKAMAEFQSYTPRATSAAHKGGKNPR